MIVLYLKLFALLYVLLSLCLTISLCTASIRYPSLLSILAFICVGMIQCPTGPKRQCDSSIAHLTSPIGDSSPSTTILSYAFSEALNCTPRLSQLTFLPVILSL